MLNDIGQAGLRRPWIGFVRAVLGCSMGLLALTLLGACGGGGGDEGLWALKSASPVTVAPMADAMQLRKAAAPIAGDLVVNGSFEQGEAVAELVRGAGYADVEVRKDLAGLDRVVVGR